MVAAESVFGQIATQRYEQQTATQVATLGIAYYTSLTKAKAGAHQDRQVR